MSNEEIAVRIAKQFINQDQAPVNFGYLCKAIHEALDAKDAKISELETEVKKLQGQWEGTTAILVKGTVSKEDWGYLHTITQERDLAEAKVKELRELIKVKDEALEKFAYAWEIERHVSHQDPPYHPWCDHCGEDVEWPCRFIKAKEAISSHEAKESK